MNLDTSYLIYRPSLFSVSELDHNPSESDIEGISERNFSDETTRSKQSPNLDEIVDDLDSQTLTYYPPQIKQQLQIETKAKSHEEKVQDFVSLMTKSGSEILTIQRSNYPSLDVPCLDSSTKETVDQLFKFFPDSVGNGSYGTFYINSESQLAMKVANSEDGGPLFHEVYVLKGIHQNKKVPEIQPCPDLFVRINNILCYVTKSISWDYKRDLEENPNETKLKGRILECGVIIQMAKRLQENEICHGDIKPENISVEVDENGIKSIYLADWGCTKTYGQLIEGEFPISPPNRIHLSDTEYRKKHDSKLYAPKEKKAEKIRKHAEKINVFQLGHLMYSIVTGEKKAFKLNQDNFLIGNPMKDPLFYISWGLSTLILDMIHPDSKKRPTALEAEERYNKSAREENW